MRALIIRLIPSITGIAVVGSVALLMLGIHLGFLNTMSAVALVITYVVSSAGALAIAAQRGQYDDP